MITINAETVERIFETQILGDKGADELRVFSNNKMFKLFFVYFRELSAKMLTDRSTISTTTMDYEQKCDFVINAIQQIFDSGEEYDINFYV